MRVAVVTANLGKFDKVVEYVPQSVPYDFHRFTDENFPPRLCSMTPRLQARIVKMFHWQMVPEYDYYIWVDSSFSLLHPDSVKWFLEQCEGVDIAVLKHPMRSTIREEADYIKARLVKRCKYVVPRYENELVDEHLKEVFSHPKFVDNHLYASTAFVWRNSRRLINMMREWWYFTSRYHTVDQLALPFVLWQFGAKVNVIPTQKHHDFKIPYLTLVRYL
jgi:hypothetical protein